MRQLVEFITQKPYFRLLLDPEITFTPEQSRLWTELSKRLLQGEPLQYVIGETTFRTLQLKLQPGVLIPRPETEELVDCAIQHRQSQKDNPIYKVCDIGCGSGCIALSIAYEIPHSQVTAVDVSPIALSVTRENAQRLGLEVRVQHCDILQDQLPAGPYDLIISNPPYIPQREAEEMQAHVLDHEPALALFVPDQDPLQFYRRIATLATRNLSPDGCLLFEIHEDMAEPIREMLAKLQYKNIDIIRDLQDKYRIISATL